MAKKVQIIARVQFKDDPRKVIYLVRSSDGVSQYEVSLFDGKATSCNCPSHCKCYHEKGCETLEAKRAESPEQKEAREWAEYRVELAKKLAAQYVSVEVVEQIAEQLVAPKQVKTVAQPVVSPKIVSISKKRHDMLEAPLTRNKSFREAIAI